MGFAPEDYEDDFVECWPEHWDAFQVFNSIANQWRTGAAGVTSLDYGVLFTRMDRRKLNDVDYEQMFEDVKEMEAAALSVFNRKQAAA